jgi:dephospho-CoA kinase
MIVGITGGIGSGKSTLCNKLRELGYPIFDTDKVARQIQNEDVEVREQIISLFLASVVFKNSELLQGLNAIVHPAVRKIFQSWVQAHSSEPILFVESALIFNSEFRSLVDHVILIIASEATRLKRVCQRDGLTEEQVRSRIVNQLSDAEMIQMADFVIDTDKKNIQDLSMTVLIDYVKHMRKKV